jgi:hypothetical protein
MIFTECPYCGEVQGFGWEVGMGHGWMPSRCHECGKVMWVELTSLGGETITTEEFKRKVMLAGDEKKVDKAVAKAINQSGVVYEGDER